jgi:hypothetical protein
MFNTNTNTSGFVVNKMGVGRYKAAFWNYWAANNTLAATEMSQLETLTGQSNMTVVANAHTKEVISVQRNCLSSPRQKICLPFRCNSVIPRCGNERSNQMPIHCSSRWTMTFFQTVAKEHSRVLFTSTHAS